jgi:hypothetical protein
MRPSTIMLAKGLSLSQSSPGSCWEEQTHSEHTWGKFCVPTNPDRGQTYLGHRDVKTWFPHSIYGIWPQPEGCPCILPGLLWDQHWSLPGAFTLHHHPSSVCVLGFPSCHAQNAYKDPQFKCHLYELTVSQALSQTLLCSQNVLIYLFSYGLNKCDFHAHLLWKYSRCGEQNVWTKVSSTVCYSWFFLRGC